MKISRILLYLFFAVVIPSPIKAQNTQIVSVSGRQLLLNGHAWIPHGLYQIAFEQPPGFSNTNAFWKIASDHYFAGEYNNMAAFGADTVRIQIAQTGIDPNARYYSIKFVKAALDAVQAARRVGLIVIISMQDEAQTGQSHPAPLPDAGTERAWTQIVPSVKQDSGIMLELFNEPHPTPSPKNWVLWAAAMNKMIADVRELGSQNVLIADGLENGQVLNGAPLLSDRFKQIVYSSHPYATKSSGSRDQTKSAWEKKFGNFSARAPVIISEWGIGYYCDSKTPRSVLKFIDYLQRRNIGLIAGTWDWAPADFRSVRYDFPNSRTSSFVDFVRPAHCTTSGFGPGQVIQAWFRSGIPPTTLAGGVGRQ
jgi:endoglucanase